MPFPHAWLPAGIEVFVGWAPPTRKAVSAFGRMWPERWSRPGNVDAKCDW